MSKTKERRAKIIARKREQYGYFGFFQLKDIYPFQEWMQRSRGFRLFPTEGNELACLYSDGCYIRVWYDAELQQCCCNRLGMAMYLTWQGLVVTRQHWRTQRSALRESCAA